MNWLSVNRGLINWDLPFDKLRELEFGILRTHNTKK